MEETDIITCLKKIKKRLKEYKKNYRDARKHHNDKMHFKLLSRRYFLFVLLLIFNRYDGVVIIIKALNVWPHFGHT